MGRPPKPTLQISQRPSCTTVVPILAERLFEQISSVDFQVQAFKLTKSCGLLIGEIPRVFQPHVSSASDQLLIFCSLLANLITTDLIHGVHEMADDVKLVEHQHRLRSPVFYYVDIRLPHVTANALEVRNSFWSKEIEEGR